MNITDMLNNKITHKKMVVLLLICFVAGVFLLLLNRNSDNGNVSQTSSHQESSEEKSTKLPEAENSGISETELEEILSKVEGVGAVKVMIIYSSTSEKIPTTETDVHGNQKVVTSTNQSQVSPFISKVNYPEIEGIIVVAEGGDNPDIINTISDCIAYATGVPLHRVKILKMAK